MVLPHVHLEHSGVAVLVPAVHAPVEVAQAVVVPDVLDHLVSREPGSRGS